MRVVGGSEEGKNEYDYIPGRIDPYVMVVMMQL